jgi:hypothetical protein
MQTKYLAICLICLIVVVEGARPTTKKPTPTTHKKTTLKKTTQKPKVTTSKITTTPKITTTSKITTTPKIATTPTMPPYQFNIEYAINEVIAALSKLNLSELLGLTIEDIQAEINNLGLNGNLLNNSSNLSELPMIVNNAVGCITDCYTNFTSTCSTFQTNPLAILTNANGFIGCINYLRSCITTCLPGLSMLVGLQGK